MAALANGEVASREALLVAWEKDPKCKGVTAFLLRLLVTMCFLFACRSSWSLFSMAAGVQTQGTVLLVAIEVILIHSLNCQIIKESAFPLSFY